MKRNLLIAACTFGLALSPLAALADDAAATTGDSASVKTAADGATCSKSGKKHHHKGEHKGGHKKASALKGMLNDDQTKQYEAIVASSRAEAKPLAEKLKALKQQPDATGQEAQVAQLRDQLKSIHKATHEKIAALLTPEQKSKLKELHAQSKSERSVQPEK